MKKNKLRCLILLLAIEMMFFIKGKGLASAGTVTSPGTACKVGKYIYYAYEMDGLRMGIMRYDTKNGKKKEITGYTYKGNSTYGFSDISLKGKYIYVTWDLKYICRVNKISGSKKRLAEGYQPVVLGKYIYYVTYKTDSSMHQIYYIYRMNLNGTGKKQIYVSTSCIYRLYSDGKKLYFSTAYDSNELITLDGEVISKDGRSIVENAREETSVINGNYKYYCVKTNSHTTKLCRENIKTGKRQTIVKTDRILDWRICGSYVMVLCFTEERDGLERGNLYCVSVNGKKKKRLASWISS